MTGVNFHPEPLVEEFRGHQEKAVSAWDGTGQVVGKTAVGIGDVFAFLENRYLQVFVKSSCPCRCACSTGHSADYYQSFHILSRISRK